MPHWVSPAAIGYFAWLSGGRLRLGSQPAVISAARSPQTAAHILDDLMGHLAEEDTNEQR